MSTPLSVKYKMYREGVEVLKNIENLFINKKNTLFGYVP